MSCAVAHARYVRSPRLSDTCGGYMVIIFVHSGVNSIKHAIKIKQITLGASIGHGWQMISLRRQSWAVTTSGTDSNGATHLEVWVAASADRQLQALQATKALPDSCI